MAINHSVRPAIRSVIAEMDTQDQKWGADRNLHPFVWQIILAEEIGEVSEEVLHLLANAKLSALSGKVAQTTLDSENGDPVKGDLRAELVQVAAVALQWVEMIDRYDGVNNE